MAIGKFSQQLQQQGDFRTSRTERVMSKERERSEISTFNSLQQEAERIKKERFTGISFEQYKIEYAKLSPALQQFFLSPSEVLATQEARKTDEKAKADKYEQSLKAKYDEWKRGKEEYIREQSKYSNRGDSYYQTLDNYDWNIDEARLSYEYFQGEKAKVEQGFTADQILDFATSKASYQRQRAESRSRAIQEFSKELNQGTLDKDLVKLGLSKDTASYDKYLASIEKYNQDVSYQNMLKSWAGKEGYEKLPQFAKERINPSAQEWQKQYPTEVLQFDKTGNVIGVTSKAFGGTYPLANYQAKINEMNAKYEADRLRQEKLTADAQKYLNEVGFGKDLNLTAPEQNVWGKIGSGLKTFWYANPLTGYGYGGVTEKTQEEMTALRSQRTVETFTKPKLTGTAFGIGTSPQIDLTTFGSLPLDKTWEVIQQQRQYDYKQEQVAKEFANLDKELSGYKSVSEADIKAGKPIWQDKFTEEEKSYIQFEALKILKGKGLQVEEKTLTTYPAKFGEKEVFGGETAQIQTVIQVTDPAFERRLSQNFLEYEKYRQEGDWMGAVAVGGRTVSLKAIETYAEWKGVELAIKGAVSGTKYLSDVSKLNLDKVTRTGTFTGTGTATVRTSTVIPKILTTQRIELASGYMFAPRQFTLAKTGIALGVTGLYGFAKFRQYEAYKQTSEYGKEFFLLETAGELAGIEMATGIGQRVVNRTVNRIKTMGMTEKPQADLSVEGFMRENKKLGFQEKVYMERFEGFRLRYPKSWWQTIQGYEKGQFIGRRYKFIPDEVLAYYKYGGDVQVYDLGGRMVKNVRMPSALELQLWSKTGINIFANRGDIIYRGRNVRTGEFKQVDLVKETIKSKSSVMKEIKAEAFPFDERSTHLKWFMRKNIQEYGVGNYANIDKEIKGGIKNIKAFGYSATGKSWTGTQYTPDIIISQDGSVLIKTKGAYQYVSGKGVSAGFLRIFAKGTEEGVGKKATDPIIYADYFNKLQVNKALREIRGISSSTGQELKAYLYAKDTGTAGTLNIAGYKKEVEGTVEIATRIPIRKEYFLKLAGWRVPIEEQIFAETKDLSTAQVNAITKQMGGITEVKGVQYSSLPSRTDALYRAIYSAIGSSKPSVSVSRKLSTSSASKMSSIVSDVISKSEVISKISEMSSKSVSYSPISYDYGSDVSYTGSSTSRVPRSKITRIPAVESDWYEKIAEKINKIRTPQIRGLFPDFTARAIGLAPKQVSVKEALKEIRKIQTGFEVRAGVRIKGLNEKDLMKGIMA